MGIGGVINRPKGQANSPSPFFICWQFLKVGILNIFIHNKIVLSGNKYIFVVLS